MCSLYVFWLQKYGQVDNHSKKKRATWVFLRRFSQAEVRIKHLLFLGKSLYVCFTCKLSMLPYKCSPLYWCSFWSFSKKSGFFVVKANFIRHSARSLLFFVILKANFIKIFPTSVYLSLLPIIDGSGLACRLDRVFFFLTMGWPGNVVIKLRTTLVIHVLQYINTLYFSVSCTYLYFILKSENKG